MKTNKQLMLAGDLYRADDPELASSYVTAQDLLQRFNATRAYDVRTQTSILRDLLASLGEGSIVKPTFRCDYGWNISIGARSFVNYDCVLLDCNVISIGDDVQIAPGVHIYTASHPLDANIRQTGLESAHPVKIGDGVWLGGRSVVCPGVTIGRNTVVGAGSVVTEDLPSGVLAVGVPCRVVRSL